MGTARRSAGDDRLGPLDHQYLRTNIEPWERYVLSKPGTLRWRLWPDGSGISNLFLTGDWVRTGLDAGCIEAAIMSGRAAAKTITGGNMFIPGFGNSGNIPIPISLLPVANLLKQLKTGGFRPASARWRATASPSGVTPMSSRNCCRPVSLSIRLRTSNRSQSIRSCFCSASKKTFVPASCHLAACAITR